MHAGFASKIIIPNTLQILLLLFQVAILMVLAKFPIVDLSPSAEVPGITLNETLQRGIQNQLTTPEAEDCTCDRSGCILPEFATYPGGLLKTSSMFRGGALQYPENICTQATKDRMPLMMESKVQALLKKYIDEDVNYLEWGTGGSTQQFYDKVKHMTSIENNPAWCNEMLQNEHIQCGQSRGRLDFICTTRNAEVGRYGIPQRNHTGFYHYHKYVNVIDYLPSEYYDVILVDGRFRMACALKALPYIRPGTGVLIIHDYERQYYHQLVRYYTKVDEVVANKSDANGVLVDEIIAVFKPKQNIPEERYDDYLEYLDDFRR